MPNFDTNSKSQVEDELHDLKLRFELLEGDRKAYYETSQWTIRQNRETINLMRLENKKMRESITLEKKHHSREFEHNQASINSIADAEIEKFDYNVCALQRQYDEHCAVMRKKIESAQALMDHLVDLQVEAEAIKEDAHGAMLESAHVKKIRQLENRLDRAMIKFTEAQSIKKTYEQILQHLQQERLAFDNQISVFESTLKTKRSEMERLELMSRDALHAKEIALRELRKLEMDFNEEKKFREKDLQLRKEFLKVQMEQNDKLEGKNHLPENFGRSNQKKKDAEKESYLAEERERKLLEYDHMIHQIKGPTGFRTIQELVNKYRSQQATITHLKELEKQYTAEIDTLRHHKAEKLVEYEQLKYTGETQHAQLNRMLQELENHCLEGMEQLKESHKLAERSRGVMVNCKAGIQHLFDKLEVIQLPADRSDKQDSSSDDIVTMLKICTDKLEFLQESLQDKETAAELELPTVIPSQLPLYNCRVKLQPVDFEPDSDDEEDTTDILDRDVIKKHAAQLLHTRMKKGQPNKKQKKKKVAEAEQ